MADRERSHHNDPFTSDNSEGYTQEEMNALNKEFDQRWNDWTVEQSQMFQYGNGELMTEEDAIKYFQDEVARR